MQKVIRDVRVELTEAERNKLGDEIAASVMRCEAIETQKRIVTADLTSSQKNERKGYREKSKALREGFVWKAIDCEERPDFARNMAARYRQYGRLSSDQWAWVHKLAMETKGGK